MEADVEMTTEMESKISINSFQSTSDGEVQGAAKVAGRRAQGTSNCNEGVLGLVYTSKSGGECVVEC